jgi:hypothetical protein
MTTQPALDKLAERYVALEAIAEAAREYRAANERYVYVTGSLPFTAHEDSDEWHKASRAQLNAEFDLYIALDVLAKTELCHS